MNDRIVIDPQICHDKPVIRGTRTPVAIVIGSLAGGMTSDEVQREYDLTPDDVRAALALAAQLRAQPQYVVPERAAPEASFAPAPGSHAG